MTYSRRLSTTLLALLVVASITGVAFAGVVDVSTSNGLTAAGGPLAIHGFDAVSYFTDGAPRRGLAEFSTLHNGAVYRFATRENLRTFVRDPERYAPSYGGFCAYGVSVGKKFDGDPEVFRIVDGRLFFNLNPAIKATWEKKLLANIDKAERQWPKIRSVPSDSL